ncbi:hypothetical protein BX600DRAFT_533866 [Xylariales sp. PMI_506]|nr:hypothetical protein BX600DRAFT_533866 [Xylariales sp. PMI_506]
MDPITALGLAQSCLKVVTTAGSTTRKIHEVISKIKNADKSIALLASQIDVISFVLSELRAWLSRDPPITISGKKKLEKAIKSCNVIVAEISISVQQVCPLPGELEPTILQRMRQVWTEDSIREQREMISTSLQAFQLIINLTTLVDQGFGDLGALIERGPTDALIESTSEDARSIMTMKGDKSLIGESENNLELFGEDKLVSHGLNARPTSSISNSHRRGQSTGDISEISNSDSTALSQVQTSFSNQSQTRRQSNLSSHSENSAKGQTSPTPSPLSPPPMSPGAQSHNSNTSGPRRLDIEEINDEEILLVKRTTSKHSFKSVKFHVSRKARTRVKDLCSHIKIGNFPGIKNSLMTETYINGYDDLGYTPLMTAIIYKQLGIAEFLLKLGANVRDGYHYDMATLGIEQKEALSILTPLHKAASMGSAEAVRLLVRYGADVDGLDGLRNITPLYLARGSAVQQLIDHGANLFHTRPNNDCPLNWAIDRLDIEAVRCLCQNGANTNHVSQKRYEEGGIEYNIDCSFLLHATNYGTPLRQSAEMVKILLAAKASPNVKLLWKGKNERKTVLEIVCERAFPKGGHGPDYVEDSISNTNFVATIQALVDGGAEVEMPHLDTVIGESFPLQDFKFRMKVMGIFCSSKPKFRKSMCAKTYRLFQASYSAPQGIRDGKSSKVEGSADSQVKITTEIKQNLLAMFEHAVELNCILLREMQPEQYNETHDMLQDITDVATGELDDPTKRLNVAIGNKLTSTMRTYLKEYGADALGILFDARKLNSTQDERSSDSNILADDLIMFNDGDDTFDKIQNAQEIVDDAIAQFEADEEAAELARHTRIAELASKIQNEIELAEQARLAAAIAQEAKDGADLTELGKAIELVENATNVDQSLIVPPRQLPHAPKTMATYFDNENRWLPQRPPGSPVCSQLRKGIEMGWSSTGKPFYIDYLNKSVHWENPLLQSLKTPIPLDWEMRMNFQGEVYFRNTSTNATQWGLPSRS